MRLVTVALVASSMASMVSATMTRESGKLNPIRRVVNMLQIMGKKVESEGKKEQEMFEKFMCYCDKGEGDLKKSIDAAENKVPQLQSSIEEANAEKAKLKGELEQAQADREDAKTTLATAQSLRSKEATEYAQYKTESTTNVESMAKAIAALRKGMGAGFLQTKAATIIKSLIVTMDMAPHDREVLSGFLSGGQSNSDSDSYAPQGGEITGLLEQMKETMEKDLADASKAEEKAKADFAAMSKAKEDQITALTRMIEDKTARSGEVGVDLVNLMDDLDDTSTALTEDKKFLADMSTDCKTKKEEWAKRSKTRTEELLAIADTIKILNDDDALDLFKKTLASAPSFIQLQVSSKELKREALGVIRAARQRRPSTRLDLVSLALRAKKTSFAKIIKMIDEMVTLLGKEQTDDDTKKAYCRKELDESEDKLKGLHTDVDDASKAIDEAKEKSATLAEDIAALTQAVKDLDQQVAEATDTRKEEHADYVEALAANNAAMELLGVAKNRLNKFYNPSGGAAFISIGGATTTRAPTGTADTVNLLDSFNDAPSFVQMRSEDEDGDEEEVAPEKAPEMPGDYKKQESGNGGVLGLIDTLSADLDKEITEMKTDEKEDQQTYEELLKDSAEKRAMNAKSITEKEGGKAELEERLHKMTTEKKGLEKEAADTADYLSNLHKECDWLLANFDVRKQARADEVEALKKAIAVLSGADYSFVQISMHGNHGN